MQISTMRRVDEWFGLPVCLGLTILRRLSEPFGGRRHHPIRRILFVKLAEQGSTVLAQAAIQRAIDKVGAENVHFLVLEENRFILDAMEMVPRANVVAIKANSLLGAATSAIGAIRELRRRKLDAAIDLEFFARSTAALCYLSGARHRVGFRAFRGEGPTRGDLMTHRLRYNPHLHTSLTFQMMVDALDESPDALPTFHKTSRPAPEPHIEFRARPDEIQQTRAVLSKASGTDDWHPLILLNANASDMLPLRKWPSDRYVSLGRQILAKYPDAHVAFTGAPAEAGAIDELVDEIGSPRCFSLAGRTTLRQLLILYGIAEVLVTNDSGPAQFAALTPIDVVVLFGPETPALFAAQTKRTHVFWAGLACSPCVSAFNDRTSPCQDNVCMQQIDTDRVFERVCQVYESRLARPRALSRVVPGA